MNIFNPYWNWRQRSTGSKDAAAEASIDFTDFISGAGSQKLTIRRKNESGENARLILTSWKIQPINPTYLHFHPLPGHRLSFTLYHKTSENIHNIEYSEACFLFILLTFLIVFRVLTAPSYARAG